jgi:phosphomannomutase
MGNEAEPNDALLERAREWLAHDPSSDDRQELQALIDARSPELQERFNGPLLFGTAGLRGLLGAGESRMNRAVVLRTAAGLAAYLLEHEPEAKRRGVVIGYDGRKLSDVFARDTASVLCAAGIPSYLSDGCCPTPLVAYALSELNAVAAVMVTASHNPPDYNGYKVYAANGAQIIAPADTRIAAAVEAAPHADLIPKMSLDAAREAELLRSFGAEMDRLYLDAISHLYPTSGSASGGDRSFAVVYTAMHGVGDALLQKAMKEAGFDNLHSVPEQREPDGNFPTVSFPNPEEEGALDLALALAKQHDAPLLLANDPDADRLAAAVRTAPGQYQQLTGNEVGVLLGHHLMTNSEGDGRVVIASIVSSPWLGAIARELGVACEYTLTGFKWIANRAMDLLKSDGSRFLFGYEEALGYPVGTVVRDKDGISAAVALAAMTAELHEKGETLLDELARIATRYGLYASHQHSARFEGADGQERMNALMQALRDDPPMAIGGANVDVLTDCLTSLRHEAGRSEPNTLPKSNVLIYELAGGHRVIARPSGTEPKLKVYVDVCQALDDAGVEAAKERAAARIDVILQDMLTRLG